MVACARLGVTHDGSGVVTPSVVAATLRREARDDAAGLIGHLREAGRTVRVAFVTSSYDTAFEPLDSQVHGKLAQVDEAFGTNGPVDWSLWIVDDRPASAGFGAAARAACRSAPPALRHRAHIIPIRTLAPRPSGLKGRAILDGMRSALDQSPPPDAIVYVNLNLKVDAAYAATGLRYVLQYGGDAAIGSRSHVDGGLATGAGALGRLKSRVFNALSHAALPPLGDYRDTTAPMKVFSRDAATHLIGLAREPHATMDAEWLLLMHAPPRRISRFAIEWIQRAGSHPPWGLVGRSVWDLIQMRKYWQAGRRSPEENRQ